jgi:hypothetical protein
MLMRMLASAPYQVPEKESKEADGGLHSKDTMDATSGETEAPSSEDEDEGEEDDIPSPHGKKRTASEDLEAKALKRGKTSLSDGSGSEANAAAGHLHRGKPLAES